MEQGAFNQTALTGKEYADWVAKRGSAARRAHEGGRLPRRQVSASAARSGGRDDARAGRRGRRSVRASKSAGDRRRGALLPRVRRARGLRQPAGWARAGATTARRPAISRSTSGCSSASRRASTSSRAAATGARRRASLRRARPAQAGARGAGADRVYVALIGWLGIYVASALFIAFFMRWLGQVRVVEDRRGEHRRQCRVLPDVRGLVQGAAAQGAARSRSSAGLSVTMEEIQSPDAGLRASRCRCSTCC